MHQEDIFTASGTPGGQSKDSLVKTTRRTNDIPANLIFERRRYMRKGGGLQIDFHFYESIDKCPSAKRAEIEGIPNHSVDTAACLAHHKVFGITLLFLCGELL